MSFRLCLRPRRVLTGLLLAAVTALPLAAGAQGPTTAVRATDFLNSLGACTHIGQGVDDAVRSAACLKYAGIRNLRDDGNLAHIPDWITVYRRSGVRTCVITNHDIPETLAMAEQLRAVGALLAVEGPNEPNNWPVTYQGQTSDFHKTALPIARFQADLYKAVKADPLLKGIPVFHSSVAGGSENDNVGLQYLTIPPGAGTLMPDGTTFADYANCHNYVCGYTNKLVDNGPWNAANPTLNTQWAGLYGAYGHTWHAGFSGYTNDQLMTLPRVTTETGWATRGDGSITEDQQGRVFLNLYLDQYKEGWKYTFIYMLHDDPIQGYYGMFHVDYTPKPAGTYLHNLTTILADSGSLPRPGRLNYRVVDPPTTVHDLLLQKSNGTFALAVWDEQASGTSQVTVDLGGVRPRAYVFDPTVGAAPIQSLRHIRSLTLTLSDHPVIIALPRTKEAP
jgi:hypothetical protein